MLRPLHRSGKVEECQLVVELGSPSGAFGALQIQMREDVMPQTVLAIATGRLGREMLRRDDSYEGVHSRDHSTGPAR